MANLTKKEKFGMGVELLNKYVDIMTEEEKTNATLVIEAMTNEIALLTKKKGVSKKQEAQNEEIKGLILQGLEKVGTPTTIKDLLKDNDNLANYILKPATEKEEAKKMSIQKISALMGQLITSELVKRTEEKGKVYFELIKTA